MCGGKIKFTCSNCSALNIHPQTTRGRGDRFREHRMRTLQDNLRRGQTEEQNTGQVAPQAVTFNGNTILPFFKIPFFTGDSINDSKLCVWRWGCWSRICHQPALWTWMTDFSLSLILLICKRLNEMILGSYIARNT